MIGELYEKNFDVQLESVFHIFGSISTAYEEIDSVKNVGGCFQSKVAASILPPQMREANSKFILLTSS